MDCFNEPIQVTRPLLPEISKINDKIKEIWDSKWLTNNGKQHIELQERLKEYLGAENLVLFVNGTLALLLGIKALGLTGEVITTPFTFPATVTALDWNGLKPVFCDIGKDTLNIDVNKIEPLINEKTTAIMPVHVFGNPCDVDGIKKIADKYRLKVIYDGAHSFGSRIEGIPIGRFGDMTMFSFHATKLFNTVEGGALSFEDGSLIEKLNMLKNFGINGPEEVLLSGLNAKMNEVQAGIGLEVLKIVDEERRRRKMIKEAYISGLQDVRGIRIITPSLDDSNSFQYFSIEVDKELYGRSRDELFIELGRRNVFCRKYFYPLCSNFSWYEDNASARRENLPQANIIVDKVLTLPFYGELGIDSVDLICRLISQKEK